MDVKKYSCCVLVFFVLTLFSVCHAAAAAQLTVTPVRRNVFVLQGNGLEDISVLDLKLSYDPLVMINPQGIRGSLIPPNAIFNFNPAAPGHISLFIRSETVAIKGFGTLATFSFDGAGDAIGDILSLTSTLVSMKATPVNASIQIMPQQKPRVENDEKGTESNVETTTGTTVGSASDSTVVTAVVPAAASSGSVSRVVAPATVYRDPEPVEIENELQEQSEGSAIVSDVEEQPPLEEPYSPSESTPAQTEAASSLAVPRNKVVYQSVLERMKEYKGEMKPAALAALFRPVAGQKVHQEPPVAVSDGESSVIIRVEVPLMVKDTPSFSFRNANMISLEQAEDGNWLIGLVPKIYSLEASVTVSFDGNTIMYPLVVVPPIDPLLLELDGSSEAAFSVFLNRTDEGRNLRFDLNGDGRFDYVDDYIFIAQFLAAGRNPARKTSGE